MGVISWFLFESFRDAGVYFYFESLVRCWMLSPLQDGQLCYFMIRCIEPENIPRQIQACKPRR